MVGSQQKPETGQKPGFLTKFLSKTKVIAETRFLSQRQKLLQKPGFFRWSVLGHRLMMKFKQQNTFTPVKSELLYSGFGSVTVMIFPQPETGFLNQVSVKDKSYCRNPVSFDNRLLAEFGEKRNGQGVKVLKNSFPNGQLKTILKEEKPGFLTRFLSKTKVIAETRFLTNKLENGFLSQNSVFITRRSCYAKTNQANFCIYK